MESQSYDIPQFLLDLGIEGTDVPKSQQPNRPSENANPIFTFGTDPSNMSESMNVCPGNIPRSHPGGFYPPPMHRTEGNLTAPWAPRDAYASNVDPHGCDRFCEPGSSSYSAQATGVRVPETIRTPDFIYTNPEGGSLSMPVALEQSTSMFEANTFDPHGCDMFCEPGSSSYPAQATGAHVPETIPTPDFIYTNPEGGSLSMPVALEQSTSMLEANTFDPHGRSRFCEPGSSSYLAQATGVRAPGTIQTPEFIFTNPGGRSSSMLMALEQSTSMFGTNTCEPTSYHCNVANERLGCSPVYVPTQLDTREENTLRSQPGFNPPSIDPAELNLSAPKAPSATSAPSGSSEPPASQHENYTRKLFPCPHCNHVFDRKFNLDGHIKNIHGNPEKFGCRYDPQCKSTFTREPDYKRHLMLKHNQELTTQNRATVPEKATERFPCRFAPKCKSTYADLTKNPYRKHLERCHNVKIKIGAVKNKMVRRTQDLNKGVRPTGQKRATVPKKVTEKFPCEFAPTCKSKYASLAKAPYKNHLKKYHGVIR